jgi:hypothetical protein
MNFPTCEWGVTLCVCVIVLNNSDMLRLLYQCTFSGAKKSGGWTVWIQSEGSPAQSLGPKSGGCQSPIDLHQICLIQGHNTIADIGPDFQDFTYFSWSNTPRFLDYIVISMKYIPICFFKFLSTSCGKSIYFLQLNFYCYG